ncbi:MAG: hypothetical protein ACJ73D_04895, partial [Pyrinomonadaceae bacterium]
MSILGLAAFMYAQTPATPDLVIAAGQDSQAVAQNTDTEDTLINALNTQDIETPASPNGDDDDKDNKLV